MHCQVRCYLGPHLSSPLSISLSVVLRSLQTYIDNKTLISIKKHEKKNPPKAQTSRLTSFGHLSSSPPSILLFVAYFVVYKPT